MKQEKKRVSFLRWPWNLVIYILLLLVLRLFAIPVILLLMAWQKKRQPDGPEEGYCLQRTRRRLARLGWAALYLLFAAGGGVTLAVQLHSDRSLWETRDYAVTAVSAAVAVGFGLLALYEAFTDIRDALFPEKSRLAKSIRAQLPYPDEAPGVKELFAMVDQDIRENGQWFDRVAVGKEWVFGDEVSYIPRIRAVFGRDEIQRHHSNNRTQTSRIVELYILDDRRKVQVTSLRNPNELPLLLDCLKLRAPEAIFRPYKDYTDYCGKSDEEWELLLRDYRRKKDQREFQESQAAGIPQNMVLTRANGAVTSRVTPELLRETLNSCMEGETVFFLTPGRPVTAQGRTFAELECQTAEDGETVRLLLKQPPAQPGRPPEQGMLIQTSREQAEEMLCVWLQGQVPDLSQWEPVRLRAPRQSPRPAREVPPPRLILVSAAGVSQGHDIFTMEDIQAAAEGLTDGSYQTVDLVLPGGYLWMRVEAGDKSDGRCKVSVTRPDPDKLRFFTTRCTHRQAAAWLLEFAAGKFHPDWKDWKDYTKEIQKAK